MCSRARVSLRRLRLLASYERDAIRPHVLGHFKDLLLATARHPAMLYYLDNWESLGGAMSSRSARSPGTNQFGGNIFARQAHGLNENYGRELMELHTLGVNGGYTQDDVIEVARCFTGWTIRQPNTKPEFVFAAFMHDTGEKTVLGHKIAAGGGEQDGLQVIDILARHPSTAKFISKKLAQRFVADDPPQALVDRMAQTFTQDRRRPARRAGDHVHLARVLLRRRLAGEDEIAARDGGERGARHGRRGDRYAYLLAQRDRRSGRAALRQSWNRPAIPRRREAWLSTANLMARIRFRHGAGDRHRFPA